MKIVFNRGFIIINALFRHIRFKLFSKKSDEKNVLIVFHQAFGDSIILSNSLKSYVKLFNKQQGYRITLIAKPSVLAFMKVAFDLPKEINYQEVEFDKFLNNYAYFRRIIKKYNDFGILVIPGTSLSGEVFSVSSSAKRRIGLVRCYDIKHPFIMRIFNKIAYTEVIRPKEDMMMLQRHRQLMNYLGDKDYKARLPKMKKQERIIKTKSYCVVCPGASKEEKCWPTNRFVDIINYITKNGIEVHLCGGNDEVKYEKIIIKKVLLSEKVISHIGKSSFQEWISIVQYADFVIGNDSATMHIAAANNVKSICLCGVYDKYQFFPYKVDELEKNEMLPVSICVDMPCEWCRTIGYFSGYGNKECKKRIKNGKCAICLDKITTDVVIKEISKIVGKVK